MFKWTTIIFFCLFYFWLLHPVHAANFTVGLNSHYTFDENGIASVKKTVRLVNQTTDNYAAEYYVDLPMDAENVVAFDVQGKTVTEITEINGQKKAKVTLNNEAVGFGREVTFALSYETHSLYEGDTNEWTIGIPGFINQEDTDEYQIAVDFPSAWGTPERVIPPPDKPYVWSLNERTQVPVTLEFKDTKTTPTVPATQTGNKIPIVVGLSAGIVGFTFLFEFVKRIL